MSITVRDVADRAGVSPATVSRVLNKNYDITRETKEAVEQAIHVLGYQRSATRRGRRPLDKSMSTAKHNSIALLIPDSSVTSMLTPLTGQLLHGAEAATRENGYQFILTRLEDDGKLSRCLAQKLVDGVIIRAGRMQVNVPLPNIPTVWVFKSAVTSRNGDMVYPDNEAIGAMAANFLLERGRRELCVLSQMPDHVEAQMRINVFSRTAIAAGARVTVFENTHLSPQDNIEKLIKAISKFDGLFLPIGDDQTELCVRGLQNSKCRLHEKLDLISCNNDVARLRALDERLPNIDIRADELGRVAAETLIWRIQNPTEYRRITLIEPRLVEFDTLSIKLSSNAKPNVSE